MTGLRRINAVEATEEGRHMHQCTLGAFGTRLKKITGKLDNLPA
jgi:hypothetical protein